MIGFWKSAGKQRNVMNEKVGALKREDKGKRDRKFNEKKGSE